MTIAASLGGTAAIARLLKDLHEDFPVPIVISQHLPFSSPLILDTVLNRHSRLPVKWAENGEQLSGGVVYLAVPDGDTTIASRRRLRVERFHQLKAPYQSGDILFKSAAHFFGKSTLAIVLTGCLYDGTAGAVGVKRHGGMVLAQDEATSVRFEMPRSAIDAGAVDCVLPIGNMASAISCLVGKLVIERLPAQRAHAHPRRGFADCRQGSDPAGIKLPIADRVESFLRQCSRMQDEAERMVRLNYAPLNRGRRSENLGLASR